MTHTDPWFKQSATLPFNPAVSRLDNAAFRVYMMAQCALAHRRTDNITEDEFVMYAPMRSWRPHMKKLVEAGLVEWDTNGGVIRVPPFTTLNPRITDGAITPRGEVTPHTPATPVVRTKTPRLTVLEADKHSDFDFNYVSPEWENFTTNTTPGGV